MPYTQNYPLLARHHRERDDRDEEDLDRDLDEDLVRLREEGAGADGRLLGLRPPPPDFLFFSQ